MQNTLTSSPHQHSNSTVAILMLTLLAALIPGTAVYTWFFGPGVITNLLLANITALVCEALVLKWRKKPVALYLKDFSAPVTATLLALCLPSLAPWWVTVISTAFAIVIAKHLYGGLGNNPFNPAMIGYVVALISFPGAMTQWLSPLHAQKVGTTDTIKIQFTGNIKKHYPAFDSVSSATPLDLVKTELSRDRTLSEIKRQHFTGKHVGQAWTWINLAFLFGGIILILRKIIDWRIPLAMIGTLVVLATAFHWYDSDNYSAPVFHLLSGGTMLAAFFIATDPVTSSTTLRGRIWFGIGIGVLTYIIRTWGGYPDGIAFAVLLMNMAAPTLDYFTQPKTYGH